MSDPPGRARRRAEGRRRGDRHPGGEARSGAGHRGGGLRCRAVGQRGAQGGIDRRRVARLRGGFRQGHQQTELALEAAAGSDGGSELGQGAGQNLLVKLGDLAGDDGGALAENGRNVGKRCGNARRRFVEHQRRRNGDQLLEVSMAGRRSRRQETTEHEAIGGKSGHRHGSERGAGSGDDRDGDAGASGLANQLPAGIETSGVPASLTRAIAAPLLSSSRIRGLTFAALWS